MDHEFKMVGLTLPFQNLKQFSENLSAPLLTLQSIPFSEYSKKIQQFSFIRTYFLIDLILSMNAGIPIQ